MIIETVTNKYHFANWLGKSTTYCDNFSFNGSVALFEWLEELSDDTGDTIEFDPIAWCCEYSEYKDVKDYNRQHGTEYKSVDELYNDVWLTEFEGGFIAQDT